MNALIGKAVMSRSGSMAAMGKVELMAIIMPEDTTLITMLSAWELIPAPSKIFSWELQANMSATVSHSSKAATMLFTPAREPCMLPITFGELIFFQISLPAGRPLRLNGLSGTGQAALKLIAMSDRFMVCSTLNWG